MCTPLEGSSIFLTGASGFFGTALTCKMVKDTPVNKIYVLVRGGESRLWKIWSDNLPSTIVGGLRTSGKIVAFEGDLTLPNLGLSDQERATIKSTVSTFVHAASTVNLVKGLNHTIPIIIHPTLLLAQIALKSEKLQSFVYISTAYANSHLHNTHQGRDTEIEERLYPLDTSKSMKSAMLELKEFEISGSTRAYEKSNFPWSYGYAKHLAERLLTRSFRGREDKLLIIRPSVIGPAILEPFPYYELPGSAPVTSFVAGVLMDCSPEFVIGSRFRDGSSSSTMDEVPIDIVVNRVLAHLMHSTYGCVHAVAGPESFNFGKMWEKIMAEMYTLSKPQLVWREIDWHSKVMHPLAQQFVVIGTSYVFLQSKTHDIWEKMSEDEKGKFPLFLTSKEFSLDLSKRRQAIRRMVKLELARKKFPSGAVEFLVRQPNKSLEQARL